MGWIRVEHTELKWPAVQFVVSHRAARVLVYRDGGPSLVMDSPEDVEAAFNQIINTLWPEYRGAALLSYGNDTGRLDICFNAVHAAFPKSKEGVTLPRWYLLSRCSRPECNGPIDWYNLDNIHHLVPTPGNHNRLYFDCIRCAKCVAQGYKPESHSAPNPTTEDFRADEPITITRSWS